MLIVVTRLNMVAFQSHKMDDVVVNFSRVFTTLKGSCFCFKTMAANKETKANKRFLLSTVDQNDWH